MDFRKTYAGPGLRSGSDPFSQLGKDVRQERDDRARQELNVTSRVNRPTQSSMAKGVGDNRTHRNALSARTAGRYTTLSQSVDLGPALQGTGHTGRSNIPRQPVHHLQQGQQAPPSSPPPLGAADADHDMQLKLQDLVDAGQQREALWLEQKRQLEASLHSTNLRCAELARGLKQAAAALDAERAAAARLRTERDQHAAELDRARSQAAELQVSGSVALTTSEVCRAALSSAFRGTVSAIGSAHEELETALAAAQQQQLELEVVRARMEELEELAYERGEEVEEARAERRQLSEAMEELAERLQAREDEMSILVSLLVSSGAEDAGDSCSSDGTFQAALAQAEVLTRRVQQLEQQLAGHGSEVEALRSQVTGYQDQIARLQQRLARSNSYSSTSTVANNNNSICEGQESVDLVTKVSELADDHEQLEMDNLQLAAENEELRRDVSAMREQLEEALVTAAVFTAAADRDVSASTEVARLKQQLAAAAVLIKELRGQVEEARAEVQAAERRAEKSAALLLDFTSQAEAARAQADAARGALEAARVEGRKLRGELEVVRTREKEARLEADEARAKIERARAKAEAARLGTASAKAEAEEARRELEDVKERASLEAEQARADGEERGRVAEREQVAVLEAKATEQTARAQELAAEIAQLRNRISELQDHLAAGQRASQVAMEQLNATHANENALMQRILAGETERQQLLRQLDEGNNTLSVMRRRLDEATQQVAEVTELRALVSDLTTEAKRQAEAAAAAGTRVGPLEAEVQDLRATLRATAESASQEARVGERREAQLASLRHQVDVAEEQRDHLEAELRVLKAQVSVNEHLRAQVDDLQARLALAEAQVAAAMMVQPGKKPLADACTQVDSNDAPVSDVTANKVAQGQGCIGGSGILLAPIDCLGSPLRGPAAINLASPRSPAQVKALSQTSSRESLVLGWLGSTGVSNTANGAGSGAGASGVHVFSTDHVVPENLLASYNAIPEEEPEDGDGAATSGRQHGKGSSRRRPVGRVRPLRMVLELTIKGTLVAGGMALGLALGNPRGSFKALTGGSNSGGRACRGDGSAELTSVVEDRAQQ